MMAFILAFSAFLQGFSGFGMALFAVPMMSAFGDLHTIVPLCLFASAFSTWLLLFLNHRAVHIRPLLPMVIAGAAGVPFGVYLIAHAPLSWTMRLLGMVILIVVAAQTLAKRNLIGSPTTAKSVIAGFLSGILGGAFGTSGPPLVVYLHMTRDPKLARSALYFAFTVIGIISLAGHYRIGSFTHQVILSGLIIMPAGMVGGKTGDWAAKRCAPEPFKKAVMALLVLLGVSLLFRH